MTSYKLEVASAGDITSVVNEVKLLWTQLPDISWDRVQRELSPWYDRMAKHGVIIASRYDFVDEEALYCAVWDDIRQFTEPGDLVIDPFCGGSTTGLAAMANERNYFGCDISQIAIDRSETRLHGYCYS